jgi:hypothetical protein
LEIDILSLMGMEVDNDIDEDEGEVGQDAKDLMMLERWRARRKLGVEDDGGEENGDDEDLGFDNIDSDDDSSDCDGGGDDDSSDCDIVFACTAILQVLMRSLLLYAATVGGFKPDSTWPFSRLGGTWWRSSWAYAGGGLRVG